MNGGSNRFCQFDVFHGSISEDAIITRDAIWAAELLERKRVVGKWRGNALGGPRENNPTFELRQPDGMSTGPDEILMVFDLNQAAVSIAVAA